METLLFDGVNTPVLQERPTGFLRTLYQEKHCQLGPKGTEMGRKNDSEGRATVAEAREGDHGSQNIEH